METEFKTRDNNLLESIPLEHVETRSFTYSARKGRDRVADLIGCDLRVALRRVQEILLRQLHVEISSRDRDVDSLDELHLAQERVESRIVRESHLNNRERYCMTPIRLKMSFVQ